MPLNWMDVRPLSFNTLLLLENVQLNYLLESPPTRKWAIALQANPHVAWYLRHKCSPLAEWVQAALDQVKSDQFTESDIRQAEEMVMETINDWLVYVVNPALYDEQPFLSWDNRELTELVDFRGKTVIDVGAGTGRLAFVAALKGATAVYAVEPVWNLRRYMKQKAAKQGLTNFFTVDGLITDIPFPNGFAEVVMGGHVFGEEPEADYQEMARVVKPGGLFILCPGSNLQENAAHECLLAHGCHCAHFEEPGDGTKRKYWQQINAAVCQE